MAKWVAEGGSEINYEFVGDNPSLPVLVLLHGFLGSIQTQWTQFVDPLTRSHRVLLIDLRGHGRSSNAQFQLDPNDLVDDVVGVIESLGIREAHISGYSVGGYIGLMAAGSRPDIFKTVHLHSTKFYWTDEFAQRFSNQFEPETIAQNAPSYAGQLAEEHGANRWRALARETQDLVSSIMTGGLTEGTLSRILQPVLVSVGDKDNIVTLPEAARVAAKLPKGSLLVLPHTTRSLKNCDLIPLLPMMQVYHTSRNPQLFE